MPNWKKVVVSGSDAILNSLYVTGPITGSDITIDDWGSISSSLASIEAGASSSNQNFQQVTDQGATTTNVISVPGVTINTTASQDFLKLGFQAGENASNSSPFGDGGVIIGTHALRAFSGTTEKVTIVGNGITLFTACTIPFSALTALVIIDSPFKVILIFTSSMCIERFCL